MPSLVKIIRKKIADACRMGMRILYSHKKIDPDKIIFLTFSSTYSCNAKYICDELLRRGGNVKLVWMCSKSSADEKDIPEKVMKVRKNTPAFFREISSAHIIIDNAMNMIYNGYKKRKGQVLLQTWHGSLGLKRIDTNADEEWNKKMHREAAMTDLLFSNSTFETDIFRTTFWKTDRIIETGHARNDLLADKDSHQRDEASKKVRRALNIPEGVHICMYAPTFRDDNDPAPYRMDFARLREALEKKFGGKWVIAFRFHFRSLRLMSKTAFDDPYVISASNYPDIQELMCAADVGITDYSSWICDYVLLKRPAFLYATDYNFYKNENRGFVYPLEELPFPLANDENTLMCNIAGFNAEEYPAKCEEFIKDKGCIDDGKAASRIADIIEKIVSGKEY